MPPNEEEEHDEDEEDEEYEVMEGSEDLDPEWEEEAECDPDFEELPQPISEDEEVPANHLEEQAVGEDTDEYERETDEPDYPPIVKEALKAFWKLYACACMLVGRYGSMH